MLNKRVIALGVALLASALTVPAAAMTATQYFEDGNRLFRDDLYWAALLRYRQAGEEGMDTPLLHYNTGIAHYRAGQYIRARESLQKALGDPQLRVGAQYNLGLNAYALGEVDEALRWFRLARDQNISPLLQKYAVIAISRIRDEQNQPDEFEIRVAEREKKREFADFNLYARVSFGQDDNVFRSPDQPYVDLANPAQPLVTPEVTSGVYMPIHFGMKYQINNYKYEGFYLGYRLSGRYYQDKEIENANEYQHEASFGNEYYRKEGTRVREVHSAFKVSQHDETYYDPDDGTSRIVDGTAIDDRMDYMRYGPEITFRQSGEKLGLGARVKAQLWNYEDVEAVPEYDHEYWLVDLYGQYKLAPSALFRIKLSGYTRRFGDRPAYDLDGNPRLGNPDIRYDYYALELTARQRIGDSFWFGFDIGRTERIDDYLGYNDYTRDMVGVELHWEPNRRFDLEARGEYYLYDYPNAFAFHNPVAGPKTQESARISLIANYRMTRHLYLVGEARYRETVSNDTRIQYERNQFVLGVRWVQ